MLQYQLPESTNDVIYEPYNTIRSLAQFLRHDVSLIDNEVLVEDLEGLATL